jgi:phospho-N-acetylmuramoyl-pentapeptide-transferase
MLLRLLEHAPIHGRGCFSMLGSIEIRAGLAALVALAAVLLAGPRSIAWLARHCQEPNRSDSPTIRRLHAHKQTTPTLGGLIILGGLLLALLAFGDLTNHSLQAALVVLIGLGMLGALDDLIKLRGGSNGISARSKLLGQLVVAALAATIVCAATPDLGSRRVAVLGISAPLGMWLVPGTVIFVAGFSNAVNLTDGLDGLAGGCLVSTLAVLGLAAYASHQAAPAPLFGRIPRVDAGETMVLVAATIGSLLGFLRFNRHPARVFMGDTGALPLGGLLGLLAVVTGHERLLLLVGGVFVAEVASVILQVGYYKWRRRRIFLCAPLHHHFQFLGWPEPTIVARFWAVSALLALFGLGMLAMSGGSFSGGAVPLSGVGLFPNR